MEVGEFDWQKTSAKFARDVLTEKCYVEMGTKLSEPVSSGVELLGKELNLSQMDMATISRHENRGKQLLKLWSRGPDTTIYVLYRALKNIRRYDVISVLQEELTDRFELVISVRHEDMDEDSPSLYHPKAQGDQKMCDVISSIDELSNTPHDDIKCIMELQPENFLQTNASKFKGKQIQLMICKSPMRLRRSNTAPNRGSPTVRVQRDIRTMPPIQETGDQDDYEKLVQRSGTITKARRGTEGRTDRIEFSDEETAIKRVSVDSGRDSTHSVSLRLSTESTGSDLDVNYIDPANRLERNSKGDPKDYWTWEPIPETAEAKTVRQMSDIISSIKLDSDAKMTQSSNNPDVGVGDYMTMPGEVEAAGLKDLPGYYPGITSTKDISEKLSRYIDDPGAYFLRKSRESNHLTCISVVHKREIVNYRIHQDTKVENSKEHRIYFIFENTVTFTSIPDCIHYYREHPMKKPGDVNGPILGRAV